MSNILEQFAEGRYFVPSTPDEFLALQLAKKLSDESAIGRYLHYVAHYPVPHLIHCFHRAQRTVDPARSFHSSLKTPNA